MTKLKVKVTMFEPILGTSPANEDVYTIWKDKLAELADKAKEEIDAIRERNAEVYDEQAEFEKGLTVFGRDNGKPIVWDYQWKGFFKDACGMLRRLTTSESAKCKAYKKVIDGLIFVDERKIPIDFDGEIDLCQRPLRASTAQGERICLACSEMIPAGATMIFTIRCLVDNDVKLVKEWMDYGKLRGFGQWRNSGMGRFNWEILEETKE